jgi:hypothetical protein
MLSYDKVLENEAIGSINKSLYNTISYDEVIKKYVTGQYTINVDLYHAMYKMSYVDVSKMCQYIIDAHDSVFLNYIVCDCQNLRMLNFNFIEIAILQDHFWIIDKIHPRHNTTIYEFFIKNQYDVIRKIHQRYKQFLENNFITLFIKTYKCIVDIPSDIIISILHIITTEQIVNIVYYFIKKKNMDAFNKIICHVRPHKMSILFLCVIMSENIEYTYILMQLINHKKIIAVTEHELSVPFKYKNMHFIDHCTAAILKAYGYNIKYDVDLDTYRYAKRRARRVQVDSAFHDISIIIK